MARKSLPKAESAIIAAHEVGKHDVYNDGYPTIGPQIETCRECAKRAREEETAVVPFVPAVSGTVIDGEYGTPPITTLPKAKRVGSNVLAPAPIPTPVKPKRVRIVKAPPEMADLVQPDPLADLPVLTMGFNTDLKTAETPRTREEWMLNAVATMRGWFPDESPVPDVRVSIGWPAGRGSSRFIGQCFYAVADHVPALFVAPSLAAVPDILETLLHEAIHAATPVGTGHKGLFVKLAKHLGFIGPWRSTPASPELKATLAELAINLGPFPHSKVLKSDATRPSVQGTRMLKVECQTCGCILRMTNKWIEEAGLPTCGCGEEMRQAA